MAQKKTFFCSVLKAIGLKLVGYAKNDNLPKFYLKKTNLILLSLSDLQDPWGYVIS